MKTIICLLAAVAISLAAVLPEHGANVEKRFFLDFLDCDSRCKSGGGCYGEAFTRCAGACYCIGSGYEYRCKNCDL